MKFFSLLMIITNVGTVLYDVIQHNDVRGIIKFQKKKFLRIGVVVSQLTLIIIEYYSNNSG